MKYKTFIAFLLAVCFLLGSCNTSKQPIDTTNSTDAITSTSEQTPTETPTELPDETASTEPDETTNEEPGETTSKEPDEVTTEEPGETTSKEPDEVTTEEPGETTSKEPDETTTKEPEETTPDASEDDAYLDIPIQKSKGYTSREYGFHDSSISLKLKLYLKWEHRENAEGGYLFLRDGIEIGRIFSGEADDVADWTSPA